MQVKGKNYGNSLCYGKNYGNILEIKIMEFSISYGLFCL